MHKSFDANGDTIVSSDYQYRTWSGRVCVFFFFFNHDGDYTTRVLNPAAVDATADDDFQRVTKIVFKSGPRCQTNWKSDCAVFARIGNWARTFFNAVSVLVSRARNRTSITWKPPLTGFTTPIIITYFNLPEISII